MRLSVGSLRRVVKGDLHIEFVPQRLTSYGGLELFSRYFRKLAVGARLRHALAALPSDYGSARLALLLLGLSYVGARRAGASAVPGRGSADRAILRPGAPADRRDGEQLAQAVHPDDARAAHAAQSRSRRRNPRRLIVRSFQLDTGAEPNPRSRKRTYAYLFRSMRTLRFLVITRAGRVTRIAGRTRLRLAHNPSVQHLYGRLQHALAA